VEVAADEQIPEGMAGEELIPAPTSAEPGDHSPQQTAGDSGLAADSPEVQQPRWGERSAVVGARGCWALNKRGEPCGAPSVRGRDYCAPHSGLGVAGDPSRYSPLGHEARRRNGAMRAELRLLYGTTRKGGVRAALQGAAEREAIRLAGSAINAALDPSIDPLARGRHALAVIEAVEPARTTEISASTDLVPSELGLSELMTLAAQNGLLGDDPEQLSTGSPVT
jgi:hypothetical protein